MIAVDIAGLPEIQRMLGRLASDQMPYAISSALNTVAFKVQSTERQRMSAVFDRPTPLIRGAFRVEKATKQSLGSSKTAGCIPCGGVETATRFPMIRLRLCVETLSSFRPGTPTIQIDNDWKAQSC